MPIVVIEGLVKNYGRVHAVRGIDVDVAAAAAGIVAFNRRDVHAP